MSTIQEIETAMRQLSPEEMMKVHEFLENLLEDQLEFTAEFAAKIRQSEREMKDGLNPLSRNRREIYR